MPRIKQLWRRGECTRAKEIVGVGKRESEGNRGEGTYAWEREGGDTRQGKVRVQGARGGGGKVGERGNDDIARERVADSKMRVGL